MNFKKKFFLKTLSIIVPSGVLLYSKYRTQFHDNHRHLCFNNENKNSGILKKFLFVKEKLFANKIMHCRMQEKNELDFISDHDIEVTDNYLKRIEEKLDYLLAIKNANTNIKNFVSKIENPTLRKLINERYLQKLLATKIENEKNFNYVFERFNQMIQPGLDFPTTKIPFIARDNRDYKLFKDILTSYIKLYHGVDVTKDKAEKETFSLIKSFLFILDEDLISKYFLEIDVTTHRNLNGFDFPASISSSKRKELKEILKNKLEELEPIVFQRIKNLKLKNEGIEGSLDYVEKDDFTKGRFSLISKNPQAMENYINKNPLLKSAGIFRDWPEDRLIYFNLDDNLLCLINEEDHLKIKLNTNDRSKMTDNLVLYFDLLEKLENNFSFAYDNEIGYLNSLPINSGASTFFNLKIKVPKGIDNFEKIKQALEESERDILLEFDEQTCNDYAILSISNKSPYYSFANLLIDIIKIKGHFK